MSTFDQENQAIEHRFVKAEPQFLKDLFGTAEIDPFWIADMDFKVAQPIIEALQRLVDRGVFAYEIIHGEMNAAVEDWFRNRHQLDLNSENFVHVPGVLTGIALLLRELTHPGDGILIQTPVYHQFAKLIEASDRKVVNNPLKLVDGQYQMDFEDIEAKAENGEVKVIMLCNPHNPAGRVWRKEELDQLVTVAEKHQLLIISDEIHADIVYSGHRFNSILNSDHSRHISILGSPAKTFGMQSIATGFLYIPDAEMRARVKKTVGAMYLDHGNAFSTYGTIAAYRHGGEWVKELNGYLETTIAWIKKYLSEELPQVKMIQPEGTYQVWLDFSGLGLDPKELEKIMFEKAKLGLTPGSWFGADSALFMRMNIASPLARIKSAFERLKEAFQV